MTKVQTTFKLARALSDQELKQIARIHAVYGMLAVRLASPGNELFVEYDSSRLTRKEVQGTLDEHGIPLA